MKTIQVLVPVSIDQELHQLVQLPFRQEDLRMLAGISHQDEQGRLLIVTHAFIGRRHRTFAHVNNQGQRGEIQLMASFIHYLGQVANLRIYPLGCAHSHPPGASQFSSDDLETFASHCTNYRTDCLLVPLAYAQGEKVTVDYNLFCATSRSGRYNGSRDWRRLEADELRILPDQELSDILSDEWPMFNRLRCIRPEAILSHLEEPAESGRGSPPEAEYGFGRVRQNPDLLAQALTNDRGSPAFTTLPPPYPPVKKLWEIAVTGQKPSEHVLTSGRPARRRYAYLPQGLRPANLWAWIAISLLAIHLTFDGLALRYLLQQLK